MLLGGLAAYRAWRLPRCAVEGRVAMMLCHQTVSNRINLLFNAKYDCNKSPSSKHSYAGHRWRSCCSSRRQRVSQKLSPQAESSTACPCSLKLCRTSLNASRALSVSKSVDARGKTRRDINSGMTRESLGDTKSCRRCHQFRRLHQFPVQHPILSPLGDETIPATKRPVRFKTNRAPLAYHVHRYSQ